MGDVCCRCLLGNFDRHNGNWGFLLNNEFGRAKTAPIYDCGSCLFPEMDEQLKNNVMSIKAELENRLVQCVMAVPSHILCNAI